MIRSSAELLENAMRTGGFDRESCQESNGVKRMERVARLLKKAWKSNRRLFLIRIEQNLFEALIPMADIMGIGIVIDGLTGGRGRERVFAAILYYVLAHSGILLARDLFTWLKDVEERRATNAVQYRYARESLEVDYPYIQTGRFLDLKKKSMKIMPPFYIRAFGESVSYLVKLGGIVSIFTVIHPLLILCVVLLAVPSVLMSFRQKKAEYQYRKEVTRQERQGNYLYRVMTDYTYAKDIRIYEGEELVSGKYIKNAEEQMGKQRRLGRKNAGRQSVSSLCGVMQLLCMLIVFSYMVYRKEISIAEYTVLLSSATLFTSIIAGFFENLAEIKEMCAYTSLIDEYGGFITDNSKVYRSQNAMEGSGGTGVSIDFERVTFRYPGREKEALKDVSFHISAGEKVSFVGLNGAGKTTIVNLILRLYEPTAGTIRINGRDIRNLAAKDYYGQIGAVLQDFFVFAYSVKENLCFGRETEEAGLTEALEQAGLRERVAALPKGLETSLYRVLDPGGMELSGGEGQKLAMARALVKEIGLLILDEPTSSLDPLAEYELFSRMRRISGSHTAIVISHRLSSTKYSDRILVFADGRLVQSGSHQELMKAEGMYGELYRNQAKYYMGEGGLYEG